VNYTAPIDNGQTPTNVAYLIGRPAEEPIFSHYGGTEQYMAFPLEIERLSGAFDKINIIARKTDIDNLGHEWTDADKLYLMGEVRSFNNRIDEKTSRLIITILAKELRYVEPDDTDRNDIHLRGVLCKQPILRKTPMGRQICDLMLAVNRRYGRSDYLPCIAWGKVAAHISIRQIGATVCLNGRIQSRKYIKNTDSGPEERTAFEISVVSLDENDQPPVFDDLPEDLTSF